MADQDAGVRDLMEGPLVLWASTFQGDADGTQVSFDDLLDGLFIQDMMLQIHPELVHRGLVRNPGDKVTRIRNLTIVLRNIRHFYEDVLGQVLVTRLPDVGLLASDPEHAADEMRRLLLLVLGCAVQCGSKQVVVDNIKSMDYETQHAIVECIQQVTDNPETVLTPDWCETAGDQAGGDSPLQLLLQHVRRLVQERDDLSMRVVELVLQEHLADKSGGGGLTSSSAVSPAQSPRLAGATPPNRHLQVELADCKARLRKVKQELEEKAEQLVELREELEASKQSLNKLRAENLELIQDARAAKVYRDELDIVQERANKADKLEAELQRYKDRMNDVEFYKNRAEELREDNRILMETKEMLEEQLDVARRRSEQIVELETAAMKYKQQITDMNMERDLERDRIQELLEENAHLQISSRNTLNESASLVAELDSMRSHQKEGSSGHSSLSDQLHSDAHGRVLRLELENQRLLALVESLKVAGQRQQSGEQRQELERENNRLSDKVEQLQDSGRLETARCVELEQQQLQRDQEVQRLQQVVETLRENGTRQQTELQREKAQLEELVDTLRMRQQKNRDARLQEVEEENCQLTAKNQTLSAQLSRGEECQRQLNRVTERLRDSSQRLDEMEQLKTAAQLETRQLEAAVEELRQSCTRHEQRQQDHVQLEDEYRRLGRVVENMKQQVALLDTAQKEKTALARDNKQLVEKQRVATARLAELQQENEQLLASSSQLQSTLHSLREEHMRCDLQVSTLHNERHKLLKTSECTQRRLRDVERENNQLDAENQKLSKSVESLKLSSRRLNELERENTELEASKDMLSREKQSLQKESARLRQTLELREASVDELTSRSSAAERDGRRLQKQMQERDCETSRLKEIEDEKATLVQEARTDKKMLCTLREELVQEKIRTQELSGELERLNSELHKIGIDEEKLVTSDYTAGESRFKALETMMEEALKKNTEIKDQKIVSLEARLRQGQERYQAARSELVAVRNEYQQLQMETGQASTGNNRELSNAKARLAEMERRNNNLLNEKENVSCEKEGLQRQVATMQSAVAKFQTQMSTLTQHNANLQSDLARIQVENTTLHSQAESLAAQILTLRALSAAAVAEKDQLFRHQEELRLSQEQLLTDHETLQKLHEQLTCEYDQLKREQSQLKSANKNVKHDLKTLQERFAAVSSGQDDLVRIKESLEEERQNLKCDSKTLQGLRDEHSRLKDDFRNLFTANEKLKSEYKTLQSDYKSLKTENNTFKLKQTAISGQMCDNRDHINSLEVEISKLTNRCEMLNQLNTALEEDRRSLMGQVTVLLTQYHDLLSTTLVEKDHYHEEEKQLADKLNDLRRQKEKLEEKIMEQYRRMDNYTPKKGGRGFGANLVRRVKRAGTDLMSRVPRTGRSRSRSRLDDVTDSQDSTSLGSGSAGNDSIDGSVDHIRKSPQRHGDDDLNGDESSVSEQRTPSMRKSRRPMSLVEDKRRQYRSCVSIDDAVLQQTEEISSKPNSKLSHRLSLGPTYRTRPATFYCDEHDTIPTRDVGPHTALHTWGHGRCRSEVLVRSEPLPMDSLENTGSVHSAEVVSLKTTSSQAPSSGLYQSLVSVSAGSEEDTGSYSLSASSPDHTTTISIESAGQESTITINGQPPRPPTPPQLPPRPAEHCRTPPLPARSLSLRRRSVLTSAINVCPSSLSSGPDSLPFQPAVEAATPPPPLAPRSTPNTPLQRRRPSVPPRQAPPAAPRTPAPEDVSSQKELAASKNSIWYEYGCV